MGTRDRRPQHRHSQCVASVHGDTGQASPTPSQPVCRLGPWGHEIGVPNTVTASVSPRSMGTRDRRPQHRHSQCVASVHGDTGQASPTPSQPVCRLGPWGHGTGVPNTVTASVSPRSMGTRDRRPQHRHSQCVASVHGDTGQASPTPSQPVCRLGPWGHGTGVPNTVTASVSPRSMGTRDRRPQHRHSQCVASVHGDTGQASPTPSQPVCRLGPWGHGIGVPNTVTASVSPRSMGTRDRRPQHRHSQCIASVHGDTG
ncbi:uncharacterized protein LOC144341371 isoform X2 [Macaca mulatta]